MFRHVISGIPTKLFVTFILMLTAAVIQFKPHAAFVGIWLGIMGLLLWTHAYGRHKRTVSALGAGSNDFSMIPALAESLLHGPFEQSREARSHLILLLPRVQRSHAEYFPARTQRDLLLAAFRRPKTDTELAYALLPAIKKLGSYEAIRILRTIESDSVIVNDHLREQIGLTRAFVEKRIRRLEQKGSLLRPANSETASALLRPAAGRKDESADVLLRTAVDSER